MRLLLIDLDNTLIDRTAAFRCWAHRYLPAMGGDQADVEWLLDVERDGYAPRADVARAMRARLGIAKSIDEITDDLLLGHLTDIQVGSDVVAALDRAARAGWHPVVVTNGTSRQQELKVRLTGLDQHLSGWVISEAAGVSKPDRRIFEIAGEAAGVPLRGGWMIGDHPVADVGGGNAAGLSTAWIHRGRVWPALPYQPAVVAGGFPEAVEFVLTAD